MNGSPFLLNLDLGLGLGLCFQHFRGRFCVLLLYQISVLLDWSLSIFDTLCRFAVVVASVGFGVVGLGGRASSGDGG